MASRATYQNICSEVTRKPWSVMWPDAEGRKKCNKCYISILEKIKSVYERIYIKNKYMYVNHVYILQNKVKCLVKSRLMLVSFYKLNNVPKVTF